MKKLARFLPMFFLIYGLVSVFTLQRDFHHITQLGIFVLLVGPSFLLLAMLSRVFERLSENSKWAKYGSWVKLMNLSATQTLTQYILIFCLPFYVAKQNWIYFGFNLIWLGTILWDPLYERLVQSTLYRHLLLAWSLLSAISFLYPFLLPNELYYFYFALAFICSLAFIPTRKDKLYIASLAGLWAVFMVPLIVLPPPLRFPLLSVWTKEAHFALDMGSKIAESQTLRKRISRDEVKSLVLSGHTLCCVAPIIAPPGLNANIRQEWTLGDRIIESVLLKTPIQGNASQQAFHSFFCKKNFPFGTEDEKLCCRIQIGDGIDIGGTSIEIMN